MKRYFLALSLWLIIAGGIISIWAPEYPLSAPVSNGDLPDTGQEMAQSGSKALWAQTRLDERGGELPVIRPLPARENESVLSALKRDVSHLKAELAALRTELEVVKSQGSEAQDDDYSPYGEKSLAALEAEEMEARQKAEEQRRQRLNDIDALLRNETVDPAWSEHAVAQISTVLAEDRFSGSYLVATDCRSTLCRLEVQHDDPDSANRFLNAFPGEVADMFPRISIGQREEDDGYGSLVLYLVRQGHRLPRWEPSV